MTQRGREARSRGGSTHKATVLPESTPDVSLRSVSDVVALVEATANQVRTGRLAPNVANCVGILCQVALKAIEGDALERRIAALEERAASRHVNGRYGSLEASMR